MNHPSMYLEWYVHAPKLKYDFRSSGLSHFMHDLKMGKLDLSANYDHGNPETAKQLSRGTALTLRTFSYPLKEPPVKTRESSGS